MKGAFEFAGFCAVSVAAHLAIFQIGTDGSAASSGAAASAPVAIAASTSQIEQLVAVWDTPPAPATHAPNRTAPQPPSAPALPQALAQALPQAGPSLPAAPSLPTAMASAPDLPDADRTTPPPPVTAQAPTASPRPNERPARQPAARREQATQQAARAAPQSAGQDAPPRRAPAATPSPAASAPDPNLMSSWGGAIRSAIERRKRYPSGTSDAGTVRLRLSVSSAGNLLGVGIAGSSGVAALDRAAVTAVQRARIPRAPNGISAGQYSFTLSVSFSP